MRKTRAQNDQFWDDLDLNVDEYMKQEDVKLFRSLSKGGTLELHGGPLSPSKIKKNHPN